MLINRIKGRLKKLMFRPYRTEIEIGSTRLNVDISDLFAKNVYDFNRNWPELEWTRRMLVSKPGAILDVGANQGVTSVFYAKTFADNSVVAFEPHPFNVGQIVKNVHLNQLGNVQICPVACGSRESIVTITNSSNAGVTKGTRNCIVVPVVTLDQSYVGQVALIKVDVEGMELEVLEGAKQLIQTHRPLLDLELHFFLHEDRLSLLETVMKLSTKLNYSVDVVLGYQGQLLEGFTMNCRERDDVLRQSVVNLLASPR